MAHDEWQKYSYKTRGLNWQLPLTIMINPLVTSSLMSPSFQIIVLSCLAMKYPVQLSSGHTLSPVAQRAHPVCLPILFACTGWEMVAAAALPSRTSGGGVAPLTSPSHNAALYLITALCASARARRRRRGCCMNWILLLVEENNKQCRLVFDGGH